MDMNNSKISVIVPVYNVEAYMDRCVETIVNQTYKNLEIILVDDGSPDHCPQMCDDWAKKDSRIKVIHKENGGVSSARNAGLDAATGEFVHFVDADDWVSYDIYSTISDSLKDNELVLFSAYFINLNTTKIHPDFDFEYLDDKSVSLEKYVNGEFLYSSFNKVFSKKLIDKYSLRFNTKYSIGEDNLFNYEYLKYSDSLTVINRPLYHYDCTRDNSAWHTKNDSFFRKWYVTERIFNDVEYEWFRSGAKSKTKLKGKAVNEKHDNNPENPITDAFYYDEIICEIN